MQWDITYISWKKWGFVGCRISNRLNTWNAAFFTLYSNFRQVTIDKMSVFPIFSQFLGSRSCISIRPFPANSPFHTFLSSKLGQIFSLLLQKTNSYNGVCEIAVQGCPPLDQTTLPTLCMYFHTQRREYSTIVGGVSWLVHLSQENEKKCCTTADRAHVYFEGFPSRILRHHPP